MNFIVNESAQKLRGGYYTPPDLARFCSAWVLEGGCRELLEPSCGDGAFLEAVAGGLNGEAVGLRAFELDDEEAAKAFDRVRGSFLNPHSAKVECRDFLQWAVPQLLRQSLLFDGVVGNPPFIRYQYLPAPFQRFSEQVFEILRLPFTKHTNAWVPFVLSGIAMMRPGGRLAMVVPSEIVHVMHAASLRQYLGRNSDRIAIIDPAEIWFEDTLQGAVILLVEKAEIRDRPRGQLAIIPVTGRSFTEEPAESLLARARWQEVKAIEGKWTVALVPPQGRALLDEAGTRPGVCRLVEAAGVDVGIVTGANKFFLVTDSTVEAYGLHKWAHPMFGRSGHCPGIVYDAAQHTRNAAEGHPTNFLWFKESPGQRLAGKALDYIRSGEAELLHQRYKCRVREPWYEVPSVYATPLGMLKRCHDAPRLIVNAAGAYTTDTAYRLRSTQHSPELLATCFLTSLTALSAEIEGRSYGGGVLELVPSEIERMLLCIPPGLRPNLTALDAKVRTAGTQEAVMQQSVRVLGAAGYSLAEQGTLADAWHLLRHRRQRTAVAPVDESD